MKCLASSICLGWLNCAPESAPLHALIQELASSGSWSSLYVLTALPQEVVACSSAQKKAPWLRKLGKNDLQAAANPNPADAGAGSSPAGAAPPATPAGVNYGVAMIGVLDNLVTTKILNAGSPGAADPQNANSSLTEAQLRTLADLSLECAAGWISVLQPVCELVKLPLNGIFQLLHHLNTNMLQQGGGAGAASGGGGGGGDSPVTKFMEAIVSKTVLLNMNETPTQQFVEKLLQLLPPIVQPASPGAGVVPDALAEQIAATNFQRMRLLLTALEAYRMNAGITAQILDQSLPLLKTSVKICHLALPTFVALKKARAGDLPRGAEILGECRRFSRIKPGYLVWLGGGLGDEIAGDEEEANLVYEDEEEFEEFLDYRETFGDAVKELVTTAEETGYLVRQCFQEAEKIMNSISQLVGGGGGGENTTNFQNLHSQPAKTQLQFGSLLSQLEEVLFVLHSLARNVLGLHVPEVSLTMVRLFKLLLSPGLFRDFVICRNRVLASTVLRLCSGYLNLLAEEDELEIFQAVFDLCVFSLTAHPVHSLYSATTEGSGAAQQRGRKADKKKDPSEITLPPPMMRLSPDSEAANNAKSQKEQAANKHELLKRFLWQKYGGAAAVAESAGSASAAAGAAASWIYLSLEQQHKWSFLSRQDHIGAVVLLKCAQNFEIGAKHMTACKEALIPWGLEFCERDLDVLNRNAQENQNPFAANNIAGTVGTSAGASSTSEDETATKPASLVIAQMLAILSTYSKDIAEVILQRHFGTILQSVVQSGSVFNDEAFKAPAGGAGGETKVVREAMNRSKEAISQALQHLTCLTKHALLSDRRTFGGSSSSSTAPSAGGGSQVTSPSASLTAAAHVGSGGGIFGGPSIFGGGGSAGGSSSSQLQFFGENLPKFLLPSQMPEGQGERLVFNGRLVSGELLKATSFFVGSMTSCYAQFVKAGREAPASRNASVSNNMLSSTTSPGTSGGQGSGLSGAFGAQPNDQHPFHITGTSSSSACGAADLPAFPLAPSTPLEKMGLATAGSSLEPHLVRIILDASTAELKAFPPDAGPRGFSRSTFLARRGGNRRNRMLSPRSRRAGAGVGGRAQHAFNNSSYHTAEDEDEHELRLYLQYLQQQGGHDTPQLAGGAAAALASASRGPRGAQQHSHGNANNSLEQERGGSVENILERKCAAVVDPQSGGTTSSRINAVAASIFFLEEGSDTVRTFLLTASKSPLLFAFSLAAAQGLVMLPTSTTPQHPHPPPIVPLWKLRLATEMTGLLLLQNATNGDYVREAAAADQSSRFLLELFQFTLSKASGVVGNDVQAKVLSAAAACGVATEFPAKQHHQGAGTAPSSTAGATTSTTGRDHALFSSNGAKCRRTSCSSVSGVDLLLSEERAGATDHPAGQNPEEDTVDFIRALDHSEAATTSAEQVDMDVLLTLAGDERDVDLVEDQAPGGRTLLSSTNGRPDVLPARMDGERLARNCAAYQADVADLMRYLWFADVYRLKQDYWQRREIIAQQQQQGGRGAAGGGAGSSWNNVADPSFYCVWQQLNHQDRKLLLAETGAKLSLALKLLELLRVAVFLNLSSSPATVPELLQQAVLLCIALLSSRSPAGMCSAADGSGSRARSIITRLARRGGPHLDHSRGTSSAGTMESLVSSGNRMAALLEDDYLQMHGRSTSTSSSSGQNATEKDKQDKDKHPYKVCLDMLEALLASAAFSRAFLELLQLPLSKLLPASPLQVAQHAVAGPSQQQPQAVGNQNLPVDLQLFLQFGGLLLPGTTSSASGSSSSCEDCLRALDAKVSKVAVGSVFLRLLFQGLHKTAPVNLHGDVMSIILTLRERLGAAVFGAMAAQALPVEVEVPGTNIMQDPQQQPPLAKAAALRRQFLQDITDMQQSQQFAKTTLKKFFGGRRAESGAAGAAGAKKSKKR